MRLEPPAGGRRLRRADADRLRLGLLAAADPRRLRARAWSTSRSTTTSCIGGSLASSRGGQPAGSGSRCWRRRGATQPAAARAPGAGALRSALPPSRSPRGEIEAALTATAPGPSCRGCALARGLSRGPAARPALAARGAAAGPAAVAAASPPPSSASGATDDPVQRRHPDLPAARDRRAQRRRAAPPDLRATSRSSSSSTAPTDGTRGGAAGAGDRLPAAGGRAGEPGHGRRRSTPGPRPPTARILLFLDDDMEADPALLAEHDRSHREGADVVLGDLPLDPASPREPAQLGRRLVGARPAASGSPTPGRRDRHRRPAHRAALDLPRGLRARRRLRRQLHPRRALRRRGHRLRLPAASRPATGSSSTRARSATSTTTSTRSPTCAAPARPAAPTGSWSPSTPSWRRGCRGRPASRPGAAAGCSAPLRARAASAQPAAAPRRRRRSSAAAATAPRLRRLFFAVRTLEYLRGAREARRARGRRQQAVVLAYHAALRPQRRPGPRRVRDHARRRSPQQLDSLAAARPPLRRPRPAPRRARRRARRCPRRRCWSPSTTPTRTCSAPRSRCSAERGIPAVVFAVSGQIGGSNEWDRHLGAGELPLLDAAGLQTLREAGIEIGSHTRQPPAADEGRAEEVVEAELRDSADAARGARGCRGRGRSPTRTASGTRRSPRPRRDGGYAAAFTIDPAGRARRRPLRAAADRGPGQRHAGAPAAEARHRRLAADGCGGGSCD